jgi:Tfp pilus assembly protein FimT
LLEALVTIAIIGIVAGMSFVAFTNVLPTIRADGALQLLAAQMRQARQASVDQRRSIIVTFQGTKEIIIKRQDLDLTTTPPTVKSTTLLSDYFLPYGMVYMVFPGPPAVPDTPDGFGKSAAVNFNCGSSLPSPCTITFQSDGSVLDHTGAYINGTVFIGKTGSSSTARAVTILGTTGRIKGYRYNGSTWF